MFITSFKLRLKVRHAQENRRLREKNRFAAACGVEAIRTDRGLEEAKTHTKRGTESTVYVGRVQHPDRFPSTSAHLTLKDALILPPEPPLLLLLLLLTHLALLLLLLKARAAVLGQGVGCPRGEEKQSTGQSTGPHLRAHTDKLVW